MRHLDKDLRVSSPAALFLKWERLNLTDVAWSEYQAIYAATIVKLSGLVLVLWVYNRGDQAISGCKNRFDIPAARATSSAPI